VAQRALRAGWSAEQLGALLDRMVSRRGGSAA